MAKIERFEDIGAWQKARVLSKIVFRLTRKPSFNQDWDFRNQMRRAANSVMWNIAEGFERDSGDKDFRHFLSIAKGSAGEVRSQLYSAIDNEFITQAEFDEGTRLAEEVCRMLRSFMDYLGGK